VYFKSRYPQHTAKTKSRQRGFGFRRNVLPRGVVNFSGANRKTEVNLVSSAWIGGGFYFALNIQPHLKKKEDVMRKLLAAVLFMAFVMIPAAAQAVDIIPGDLDGSGTVDPPDSVIPLQCLEKSRTEDPFLTRDANNDYAIDMFETDYALSLETGTLPKFTNSLGMTFVYIPPGSFMMGSPEDEPGRHPNESPRHMVTFSSGFYMQTTEVTQAQWKEVMGYNLSYFTDCGGDCPVESVPLQYPDAPFWGLDIQNFIAALNALGEGTYRLPTEAEWEYAARAGSTTAFANGGISEPQDCSPPDPNLDAMGWYCGNSGNTTHPVARKQPNAWGLYDMHGNVMEVVEDDWHDDYTGAPTDGSAWVDSPRGSLRVLRGGGYDNIARNCRSARRSLTYLENYDDGIGFRLACPSGP
jgi:formylglycine-generating enzyme required for sulfatase activity